MTTDPVSTAEYVRDLATELAGVARSEGLQVVAALLEMAASEAARGHTSSEPSAEIYYN
jgi:hypothetical protein